MIVTIDISMYPNREEFVEPIKGFIEIINTFPEIKIKTFPTSTVIQGEYAYTMKAAQDAISEAHVKYDKAVYVMKIIRLRSLIEFRCFTFFLMSNLFRLSIPNIN